MSENLKGETHGTLWYGSNNEEVIVNDMALPPGLVAKIETDNEYWDAKKATDKAKTQERMANESDPRPPLPTLIQWKLCQNVGRCVFYAYKSGK